MKKNVKSISNPDELDKHLQYTSPTTWIVLGSIVALLIGFFVCSFVLRIKEKVYGVAQVKNSVVTLTINDSRSNRIEVGQTVYILNQEGKVSSINEGVITASNFTLKDDNYDCSIVIKEIRPIDFLIGR